jgi:hypothetical protein
MLVRLKNGILIEVRMTDFKNDKLFYEKLIEIQKDYTDKEIKEERKMNIVEKLYNMI